MLNGNEWEDIVVFLTKEEAIQKSVAHPNVRIEIFSKNPESNGYLPTYKYFKGVQLYKL